MSRRTYEGPALDLSYQYITERPQLQADGGESSGARLTLSELSSDGGDDQDDVALEGEDELVYATPAEPEGEERTVNVVTRPDGDGQSTLEDWGWSS